MAFHSIYLFIFCIGQNMSVKMNVFRLWHFDISHTQKNGLKFTVGLMWNRDMSLAALNTDVLSFAINLLAVFNSMLNISQDVWSAKTEQSEIYVYSKNRLRCYVTWPCILIIYSFIALFPTNMRITNATVIDGLLP